MRSVWSSQVAEHDPLNTIPVPVYLKEKLFEAQATHGDGLVQAFAKLDKELLKSVEALMTTKV